MAVVYDSILVFTRILSEDETKNLVAELEDVFAVSLEPEEIGTMKSFNDIIRILKDKGC